MPPRPKATLYDIVERIIHMYHKQKKQIREIESILKAEGYHISRSSIHRTIKGYNEVAKELLEIKEEVKALMESVKENPATDTLEIIINLITTRVMKFAKDIIELEFDDPEQLANTVHKLATAAEKLQRYREERLLKTMKEVEGSDKQSWTKEEVIKLLREAYEG